MPDGSLHGLCALQDLGHDEFVVVKQAADLIHTRHERTVDDIQGWPLVEGGVEVVDQPVFGALYDIPCQPFIQRQVGARILNYAFFFLSKVGGKGGDRVCTAPIDQIVGETFFFFGNRGVAFQLFRVHNRQVEPRLDAVVEKHGVQYLTPGRWEAKGHIADAQDGLAGR